MASDGGEAFCLPLSFCAPIRNLLWRNNNGAPAPPVAPVTENTSANPTVDPPGEQIIAPHLVNPVNVKTFTLDDVPSNVQRYTRKQVKQALWPGISIGEGATANVSRGVIGGKPVAIKQLNKDMALDFFEREIKILAPLDHPKILGLVGVCFDGDDKFIFFDLMSDSLKKLLSTSGASTSSGEGGLVLSWKERLLIALDVIEGLQYLHEEWDGEMAVIHRDLKPENILLDKDRRARIADFGCAVKVDKMNLPATGILVAGTFGYMDPHYCANVELTLASDIYTFGVILVDLITGKDATPKITIEEGVSDEFVTRNKDPKLEDASVEGLRELFLLARDCMVFDWTKRPSGSVIKTRLEQILNM